MSDKDYVNRPKWTNTGECAPVSTQDQCYSNTGTNTGTNTVTLLLGQCDWTVMPDSHTTQISCGQCWATVRYRWPSV